MKLELRRRLTHKYVGSSQDLDVWETYGEVTVLDVMTGNLPDNADPSDMPNKAIRVHLELDVSTKELMEDMPVITKETVALALHDTFHRSGCACSHDCCGCVSTRVESVFMLEDDNALVMINESRNY